MGNVIQRLGHLNRRELALEIGGVLLTASVIINCLISKQGPYTLFRTLIFLLCAGKASVKLPIYMTFACKEIAIANLKAAFLGGTLREEEYEQILDLLTFQIQEIPIDPQIEAELNTYKVPLHDARRLEYAFQHDLSVVSCEAEHLSTLPEEREHLNRYEYAHLLISEDVEHDFFESELNDLEESEQDISARVWVFTPKSLYMLLKNPDLTLESTARKPELKLVDHNVYSNKEHNEAEVTLAWRGQTIQAQAQARGPADATLRAIESGLREAGLIDLDERSVRVAVLDIGELLYDSDTDNYSDVRVQVRVTRDDEHPPLYAYHDGGNVIYSTALAYVRVIDTLLRDI